jgi:hypothetical protein
MDLQIIENTLDFIWRNLTDFFWGEINDFFGPVFYLTQIFRHGDSPVEVKRYFLVIIDLEAYQITAKLQRCLVGFESSGMPRFSQTDSFAIEMLAVSAIPKLYFDVFTGNRQV